LLEKFWPFLEIIPVTLINQNSIVVVGVDDGVGVLVGVGVDDGVWEEVGVELVDDD
jgi:hypothetical protein